MKIIIINYRYFISGGPERYLFNIKSLLESNGHKVIPFSIKNRNNVSSEFDTYFLQPVGKDDVYFKQNDVFNLKVLGKSFERMFYSFEAKSKLNKLIKATQPDLIYVLQYQNKISSSIFDAAKENNIPVIHRISDFGQICSNGMFYRPNNMDVCERCLFGSKINAITNKCVHNSYLYSLVKASALAFQNIINTQKKINAFVIPSKFTLSKLKAFGVPENKLFNIPTFFNFSTSAISDLEYNPFALYIGRIEENKGLWTLVKAFEGTNYNLKIIGFSSSGLEDELKLYLSDKVHKIQFLGKKDFKEIDFYLRKCAFTIVPSEWYDNFPNTILESFAFKKCVVATDLGSLKETVINNETGLLFNLKDITDLRKKISLLLNDIALCKTLGENAFLKLTKEFSAEIHYAALMQLFQNTINNYLIQG